MLMQLFYFQISVEHEKKATVCNSVLKHSALANLCPEKGAALAEVKSVEDRLTKQISKAVNKYKQK